MKAFAIIVFVVKTLVSMVIKVFSMSKKNKNDHSSFDIERQIADAIKAGDTEKVARLRKYLQTHKRRRGIH